MAAWAHAKNFGAFSSMPATMVFGNGAFSVCGSVEIRRIKEAVRTYKPFQLFQISVAWGNNQTRSFKRVGE